MSENKILDIEYDEVSVYVKLEDVSINKDIMQSSILGARDYILKYLEENIQEQQMKILRILLKIRSHMLRCTLQVLQRIKRRWKLLK